MAAWFSKIHISHKTVIFILFLILLPLAALAMTIIWVGNQSFQSEFNTPNQTLACNQLARVEGLLEQQDGQISQSDLSSFFAEFPDTYGYYLLNGNNQIVGFSHSPNGAFPVQDYLQQLIAQGRVNYNQIQASICTSSDNWKLILVSPSSIIVSNNKLLFNTFIITFLIISILITLFAILLNHQLINPIKMITQQFKKAVAEDYPDFESISAQHYSGEIGELLTAYNQFSSNQKQRMEKEKLLHENSVRYELATQGAKIGIWDWNLKTNHCYFSPSWRSIIGHTEETIRNLPAEWFTRVHPEDIEILKLNISEYIDGKTSTFEQEHRLLHMDNTYIWALAKGVLRIGEQGEALRLAGTLEDITERKAMETKLLIDAMYDPLTGLPNRTYFSGVVVISLGRIHRREDYHSAVLYVDLDRFKTINENFSFSTGDALLQEISRRLKFSLRSMDTISHFGDDKFAILLEEINGLPDTIKITQRLHKEIEKPFIHSGITIHPGTSIGIVMLSRGYQGANEVLRDAESAMFLAKTDGRGKIEVFDKEVFNYTLSKIKIERELKNAINNHEFSVLYQPVYDIQNNNITHVKAIPNWIPPGKGIVLKDQYQTAAEETGEIIAIDQFTLQSACNQAGIWFTSACPEVVLSILVSTKTFLQPNFTDKILSILADSSLPNEALQIVLTESSQIYNSGIALQTMVDLSSIGVKFCLADFGVTPSSLEQLKRLPIHAIEISDSLIRGIPANVEDVTIIQAIISLSSILGYQLTVPGVDSKEQADFLRQKGIQFISGNYFSKPLNAREFHNLLCRETD